MCGIAGVYKFNNSQVVSENEIKKMSDALVHRGPDGNAAYFSADKKIGPGHRRLAIIDLSPAGAQPMANENKTIWIVFNGEIYNFQELRSKLEKAGHSFRSRSDTEVIIHSYEEYGFDCVKKFNGMFAFAIWDENKQLLFAGRDHLGVKPFYYAIQNGNFYFGSEIKAILVHPDFKKDIEETNISHYLTFSCLPSPHTLFKDIKKLAPAKYLIINKNGIAEEKEYWNPVAEASLRYGASPLAEKEYIDEIRKLLRDSVKSQMVSDVPFGCFLSGGIDSSTNAALMSEALGKPVETFSIGSQNFQKYNEFQYSRKMAEFLKTKPHELLTTDEHLKEFLKQYAYFNDAPNGDQVCVPLFWLSEFTRKNGVTVIQIGEGSDEIFAGYPAYIQAINLYNRVWRWLEKMPQSAKNGIFKLSAGAIHPRFDFYKEYLLRLKNNQEPFWGNAVAFGDFQKEKLLTTEYKNKLTESSYSIVDNYYKEIKNIDSSADFMSRLTYLEIKHRLPELLLMRSDKMTMAHSVEARVPFLDKRLVELAVSIPANIKIKNGEPKYILKKSV